MIVLPASVVMAPVVGLLNVVMMAAASLLVRGSVKLVRFLVSAKTMTVSAVRWTARIVIMALARIAAQPLGNIVG